MSEDEREELLVIRRGLPFFKHPIEQVNRLFVAPVGYFKDPQQPTLKELAALSGARDA